VFAFVTQDDALRFRQLRIRAEEDALAFELVRIFAPAMHAAPATVTLAASDVWQSVAPPFLAAAVEGIALRTAGASSGCFVVSSQDSNSFACCDRGSLASIYGTWECDGIDITVKPCGPAFPSGVVIVHDGRDTPTSATNFKWTDVSAILRDLTIP